MRSEIVSIISKFSGQANLITTPRIFVKLTGDLHSALLLNQLLYWQDKIKGEWLFKTYKEWEEEICLSEYQVRKASKKFIEWGFLETEIKKANGNPTVHFRLNRDKFMDWFLKNLSMETENINERSSNISESLIKNTIKTTNKEKERGETPFFSENESIPIGKANIINKKEYNNLLQEEYKDILKIFSDNGLKIQLTRSTKTCEKVYNLLKGLETGKGNLMNSDFDQTWFSKYGITSASKYFKKGLSVKALSALIRKSAKRFNDMRTDARFFTVGGSKGVTVENFLYNSFGQKSFFLQYLVNEPIQNRDYQKSIQYEAVVKKFENMKLSYEKLNSILYNNSDDVKKFTQDEKWDFIFTTNELHNWCKDNSSELDQLSFGGFKQLLERMGEWLQSRGTVRSNYMSLGSPPWHWFNTWCKENIGVDYRIAEKLKGKPKPKKVVKEINGKQSISQYEVESRAEEIMMSMSEDDLRPYQEMLQIAREQLESERG